ncbi:hypothetical protein [Oscillatoria sp. FACHB-1406]|nr:hypothetical protein [Oscillatoria sp. FACHB-1406]MBD2576353.1 hypothetical protein [Oscillatoria sp. FACHB-1406]
MLDCREDIVCNAIAVINALHSMQDVSPNEVRGEKWIQVPHVPIVHR